MILSDMVKLFARQTLGKERLGILYGLKCGEESQLLGLCGSSFALYLSAIAEKNTHRTTPIVVITNDEEEAGFLCQDLSNLLGEERVLMLHSGFRRQVKLGRFDEPAQILRTEVVSKLAQDGGKGCIIITYAEALSVKVASTEQATENSITIKKGDYLSQHDLIKKLLEMDFNRVDYVYEPGQMSVRGSIIDVFSYSLEYPVRIDFFGDEIESLRTFNVESQLSQSTRDSVTLAGSLGGNSSQLQTVPFWALLPKGSLLFWRNRQLASDKVHATYETGFLAQAEIERQAMRSNDDGQKIAPLSKEALLWDGQDWEQWMKLFRHVNYQKDSIERSSAVYPISLKYATSLQPAFKSNMELLCETLQEYHQQDYELYLVTDDEKQLTRLQEIFEGLGISLPLKHIKGSLHEGFIDNQLKCCFFTDHQIFERFHRFQLRSERAKGGRVSLSLKEIREIEYGDYVVHIDHGVGRFEGLVILEKDGIEQEMIKITYKGGDVVYVSIHQLHKVSKYRGKDAEEPQLSRLGTGAWDKMKERTKKRIKDIARDLIKLYAQRRKEQGFAYSKDSYLQQELEASFVYEDTIDQARVTKEIKTDMESTQPMDRLVCGDVGFGKTELAVRAAYKAAADAKQVALLVPTTVLAYQHYQTFSQRLKEFGVNIAYLTRAQSAKKVKEIKEGLQSGKIDIVIGTQKILGKDIVFHDLGLLIIDEEQKFGVAVKEKIRQKHVNIDTLTLSATPIPRTLQFSLMGARDLSVLRTPPSNRQPIHTEIHLLSHEVIADAVNYELSRQGQIYIVFNKISALTSMRDLILKYVPDARIAIGHGQMPPQELEDIVFNFINHEYDILLSTTIVENGIDIPNANTIIIIDAHKYGLSDLHQMRGRVGRSGRKAFCYLLAPPMVDLTDEARRRLEAIENFSELGSGIHIAMQDLDIRGAGNLLGAEQSGFIADLGYETYQKILSQAMQELKMSEFPELYDEGQTPSGHSLKGEDFVAECNLESDLPLFFSEEFMPGASERMENYRKLSSLQSNEEVAQFKKELEDRFGKLPTEAQNLLLVNQIRRVGRSLGVERILLKRGNMSLYFVSNPDSPFYDSQIFSNVLSFVSSHASIARVHNSSQHFRIDLKNISTIQQALFSLSNMNAN